jgi:hypothetical protein
MFGPPPRARYAVVSRWPVVSSCHVFPPSTPFFFRGDQPEQIRSLLLVTAVECRRRLLQNFVSTSVFKNWSRLTQRGPQERALVQTLNKNSLRYFKVE